MTQKRFENRLNKNNLKFLYQNPVWDNEKEDALNVFEMIDLLNELSIDCRQLKKENEQLKLDKQQLHRAMSREEVRHKQFKNKVFDLINEKIKEYQKYDEYDTEKYYIGTQLLNKLKKELLE